MDKFSELKATALAATPGPWESEYDDWSDGDDALISSESRDGMVAIAKVNGGGEESGYDEPFSSEQQANAAFIAAANPAAVLALLAEYDASQKALKSVTELWNEQRQRLAELEEQSNQLKKELHNEGAANAHAYERIRELEKRLATPVRSPDDGLDDCRDMWPQDCSDDFDTGYKFGLWRYEQNICAAGFTVEDKQ